MARRPLAYTLERAVARPWLVVAAACALPSTAARAQQARRVEVLPDSSVLGHQVAADPKPMALASHLGLSGGAFGRRSLWIAVLGTGTPLLGITPSRQPWRAEVGLRTGVATLFDTGTPNIEMLTSDFYVTLPVTVSRGQWSVSVAPWHESSHIGDEYAFRTRTPPRPVSHDHFTLHLMRRGAAGRVYVGAHGLSLRPTWRTPGNVSGNRVLAGFELLTPRLGRAGGVAARLLFGVDDQRLRAWGWARSTTAAAGLELARASGANGGRLRVIVTAHDGVAPYWQFGGQQMRWFAGGVQWAP